MKEQRISEILAHIKNVKIAVYGDFCIDAYWLLDPRGSEVSLETGLQAQAVGRHYYSLGGASNVVANLAALKPASIQVIGVVGDDIFGRELSRQFKELGIDTSYLVVQKVNFDTVTFGKPYIESNELPRMDFGFFNKRTEATDQALLNGIKNALQTTDALIFNQQVPGSITNESFIDSANDLFGKFSDKIVLFDSRHYGRKFRDIYRKTNDLEAAQLNNVDVKLDDVLTLADVKKYAENLYRQFDKPVFLTRGSRGIITVDSEGYHEVPGIQLLKKLDIVGAGDTVTSALTLCLGAGLKPAEAAEFANIAAAVTVQKLFQTGTASDPEIIEVGKDADYIYQPELATDRRAARYFENTEIELCWDPLPKAKIKHAVFDHDGTVSTLRQGWEQVMAPMMVRAILGEKYKTADETLYHKVRNRVLDYIDQSTGIQTIVQMEALVEMSNQLKVGLPEDSNTDLPALGTRALYQIIDMTAEALGKGAKLETGGYRMNVHGERDDAGLFYMPTILSDVPLDCKMWYYETFGPVLPVMRISSFEQAISQANNTPYGLRTSVYSDDPEIWQRFFDEIDAPGIAVNTDHLYFDDYYPHLGGLKTSGIHGGKYFYESLTYMKYRHFPG